MKPPLANADSSTGFGAAGFRTTHWSAVLAAGQDSSPQAAAAMEQLCRDYWYPLYVYARRKGHQKHDAQDLTQEFFARLIRHNCFGHLRQHRGLFRSYLLKAFQFFMADQWDHARAEKRGGGQFPISLDDEQSEIRYLMEPVTDVSPERVFDQRWALTLLEKAINRLRAEFAAIGKEGQFEALKSFLSEEAGVEGYDAVGLRLAMTPSAVRGCGPSSPAALRRAGARASGKYSGNARRYRK
jgi:RNA polymerase sigma-70 factor (ECF subfamily)